MPTKNVAFHASPLDILMQWLWSPRPWFMLSRLLTVFKQHAGDSCHQDNQGDINMMHGKQWFSPWLHIVISWGGLKI